jgi:hypothetical protein
MPSGAAAPGRLATVVAVGCAVATLLAFLVPAWALVGYPWDWSPDEGLTLDYARRMLQAPGTLYTRSVVPAPSAWGPVLPLVLTPALAFGAPLGAARVIALVWTAAGLGAVWTLVRREGSSALALSAVALAVAPLSLSYFTLILRPDGLLVALWLLAAVALLPRRLEPGADRLTAARIAWGTALLLLAGLVKLTIVFHGLPLVAGWLLVDRPSAARLTLALTVSGALVLVLFQGATGGAFLWVSLLWRHHGAVPGQEAVILLYVLRRAWPLLAALAAGALLARRAGRSPHRDGSMLLLAGGLAIVPTLGKYGAWWNYLLPLLAATAVAAGRLFALAEGEGPPSRPPVAAALLSALSLVVATATTFPVPTGEDERTARAFYGMVTSAAARSGAPIQAMRPEMAYFVAGQPAEVEGSGFESLASRGVPGTELVRDRIRAGRYALLAITWPLPATTDYTEAVAARYRKVAVCTLGYCIGPYDTAVYVRRDLEVPLPAAAGTRCRAVP